MLNYLKTFWHQRQLRAMERRYAELRGVLHQTQKEMAALGTAISRKRGTYHGLNLD